jgi:hypothetical protein
MVTPNLCGAMIADLRNHHVEKGTPGGVSKNVEGG